jgi:hypothetical protein
MKDSCKVYYKTIWRIDEMKNRIATITVPIKRTLSKPLLVE